MKKPKKIEKEETETDQEQKGGEEPVTAKSGIKPGGAENGETGGDTPPEKPNNDSGDKNQEGEKPADTPPERLELTISREHLISPHSIELRRKGTSFVQEVRTNDHAHSEPLGAKTIAAIFQENGAPIPSDDKTEMIIKFSPHTGEIIFIT